MKTEFALTIFLERIIRFPSQYLQEINFERIHIFSIFIGPQFNNISLVIPKNYSWELFWVYSNDFCSHIFMSFDELVGVFGYRKRGFTKSYALFFIRKFWYHFFCCLKLLFWHFLSVFREENSSSRNSMAKIYTHIVIFFCWILFLIQELEKSSFLTNYT